MERFNSFFYSFLHSFNQSIDQSIDRVTGDLLGYKELIHFDFTANVRTPGKEGVTIQILLSISLLYVIIYLSLTLWVCKWQRNKVHYWDQTDDFYPKFKRSIGMKDTKGLMLISEIFNLTTSNQIFMIAIYILSLKSKFRT